MSNNKNGFTYPFTLIVLLLFISFFSVRVDRLLSERKLANETYMILQQEYYFLSCVKKIEKMYQGGITIPSKGTFPFSNGTMDYLTDKPIGTSQSIGFTYRPTVGDPVTGRGIFDINAKKLTKWMEKH